MLARYLELPGSRREGLAKVWPDLLAQHQRDALLTGETDVERTKRELRAILSGAGAA